MFQVIIDSGAELDVDEIFKWYEKQRQGLGFEFLTSFDHLFSLSKKIPLLILMLPKQ